MLRILILLMISLPTIVFAHEGHQAFYKLSVENGELILTSKLEIPDVKEVLAALEFCGANQDFNWCAGTWLADNLSIIIDGKTYPLNLESSVTEDGHLLFIHSLGSAPTEMKSVEITNTTFLAVFPDYENIFQTTLDANQKGFKMNKERTKISITIN